MTAQAPEISVSQWFNTKDDLTLEALRGKIVVLHAFQMLCPGCVSHGTPQAEKISRLFPSSDVQVIGLHTVFEHHAAMTPVSLQAFIHEYKLSFPIGVDLAQDGEDIPVTMQRYQMRGTPTMVVIDRMGIIRHHSFGQTDDMVAGAAIGTLLGEKVV